MASYDAPLRDMRFVYHELHDHDGLAELPGYAEATPDIVDAVLEEAGRFCSEVLAPLNGPGDAQGCRLEVDGTVRTPDGFVDAYRQFVEGGWNALAASPEHGGQGLPHALDLMVQEMISSANLAFGPRGRSTLSRRTVAKRWSRPTSVRWSRGAGRARCA
jgi:alkylation response protein AidB-like acyl-CoA dehydrogenase